MASISFDGHSFLIDGKRLWLVSGVLDYARIPAGLWRRRIRQAREAGLNCLAVSVMWNVHEPQPGVFRFDGRADLRKFVQMIGEEGMRCFLRPGPFVNGGWDAGGLPAWLRERGSIKDESAGTVAAEAERVQVRQADSIFLQAVARYFDAVMERVKDLQATTPASGPIVLVQVEHEWLSHNPKQAEAYLEQLTRFLRESGCNVPLINTNNLWQQVPGTIDGWNGDQHVFTNCRQLRVLRPDAPCIVTSLPTGRPATWGGAPGDEPTRSAAHVLRRMAEVSAAGGMFNLDPFCGGTNFGFHGGRLTGGDDRFVTTSNDCGAPLSETGFKTDKYLATKRIATFLSQFDHVMANLTLNHQPTVSATHLSVVHQSGTQGHVVFILRDEDDRRTRQIELSTPDGQSLPVHMGEDTVAWVLLEANLHGVARLDLTNLRPWALIERQLLVMFGPAGSDGIFSIDGVLRHVTVPSGGGGEPLVIDHDGLKIAVLNQTQIDAAYLGAGGLHVGIAGFDDDKQPLPHADFGTSYVIAANGNVTRQKLKGNGRLTLPRLGQWQYAAQDDYAGGTAPRFATLDGPRSLGACGADFGYGWYRIKLKPRRTSGGGGKVNLLAPEAGDRLHLYQGGKLTSILGVGPGVTAQPAPIVLAGDATLVVLADNLGRFSEDLRVDQPKGLYGELYDVKPMKLGKPDVATEPRVDPFQLSGYVPHCSSDERGPYQRYTFTLKLTSTATPLILSLHGERPRSVILVNDRPVAIDIGRGVNEFHVLHEGLKRGNNRITLALIDQHRGEYDPRKNAELFEVKDVLSAGGGWWYARWQLPDAAMYQTMPRATPNLPTFYRTTFRMEPPTRPVMLELAGASKGQIYFNGHNLGRYFLTTASGKKVGPQKQFYLPEPWFTATGDNELIIFDEHGKAPTGTKLALP